MNLTTGKDFIGVKVQGRKAKQVLNPKILNYFSQLAPSVKSIIFFVLKNKKRSDSLIYLKKVILYKGKDLFN